MKTASAAGKFLVVATLAWALSGVAAAQESVVFATTGAGATGAVAAAAAGGTRVIIDGGLAASVGISIGVAAGNIISGVLLAGFLIAGNDQSAMLWAPPMDPNRTILEVDCTKPLPSLSGNIRCLPPPK